MNTEVRGLVANRSMVGANLLLSWIQPLINGKAYILDNIPWWVAAVTHALYGLTIALVSHAFRNDVDKV